MIFIVAMQQWLVPNWQTGCEGREMSVMIIMFRLQLDWSDVTGISARSFGVVATDALDSLLASPVARGETEQTNHLLEQFTQRTSSTMTLKFLFMLARMLVCASALSAPSTEVTRREAFLQTAGALSFLTAAAPADAATGAELFVGTYTDPINHPGGTRTVRLVGDPVGEYQLAEVLGGGGRGEPEKYVLPAAILGGRTIVIDFSVAPKYGPKDFVGILDGKSNIKFLRDGNTWPRQ